MKYIRMRDGIYEVVKEDGDWIDCVGSFQRMMKCQFCIKKHAIIKQADTIEELCDCFVKIKRKGNCKPYILKFDYKDLPTLKEQAIKYKDSSVYGAVHIEDKGLIYVAKMNEKGELELL